MSSTARPTAADDLRAIINGWDKLRALVDTSSGAVWPPARGQHGIARDEHDPGDAPTVDHVQHLVTVPLDEHRVGYECIHCDYVGEGRGHTVRPDRDPAQLGERPVPIRLHVVDACVAIEAGLVELCDELAGELQASPLTPMPAVKHAGYDTLRAARVAAKDRDRRNKLAADDASDPRRWHYVGPTRTAEAAADWLLDRITGYGGPFKPLPDAYLLRIETVARQAARRLRSAIGAERTSTVLVGMACPGCKGPLTYHTGGDEPDIVSCSAGLTDCTARVPWHMDTKRREWDGEDLVELLVRLDRVQRELREARALRDADERRARRAAARRRQRAAARDRAAA